jgi:hypothetical protein
MTHERSIRSRTCWIAAVVLMTALRSHAAQANSTGITTGFFGSTGCNSCHGGGAVPQVELTGPTTVNTSSTNEYTFHISTSGAQNKGGFNVSAPAGVLTTGGTNSGGTQALTDFATHRAEVTHTTPRSAVDGVIIFSFLWNAPNTAGTVSLSAWGNAVNGNGANTGDAAAHATLDVTVLVDQPTETPTATPTASPSPTPVVSSCPGDCTADNEVTIDEILIGVNIAAGTLPVDGCLAFDVNHDGDVTIEELLQAVNAALTGCG